MAEALARPSDTARLRISSDCSHKMNKCVELAVLTRNSGGVAVFVVRMHGPHATEYI